MDDRGVIYLVECWLAGYGPGDQGLIARCEGTMPADVTAGDHSDRSPES
jgi:hypothetical protein